MEITFRPLLPKPQFAKLVYVRHQLAPAVLLAGRLRTAHVQQTGSAPQGATSGAGRVPRCGTALYGSRTFEVILGSLQLLKAKRLSQKRMIRVSSRYPADMSRAPDCDRGIITNTTFKAVHNRS